MSRRHRAKELSLSSLLLSPAPAQSLPPPPPPLLPSQRSSQIVSSMEQGGSASNASWSIPGSVGAAHWTSLASRPAGVNSANWASSANTNFGAASSDFVHWSVVVFLTNCYSCIVKHDFILVC
uniref:Uncharacterized protein n=1 Tax=Oryza brachyantha TaxID=4533 RepID=J3NAC1_ORYBR